MEEHMEWEGSHGWTDGWMDARVVGRTIIRLSVGEKACLSLTYPNTMTCLLTTTSVSTSWTIQDDVIVRYPFVHLSVLEAFLP